MVLPPLSGFNVITRPDGTQVYSRYTENQLQERDNPAQPAIPISTPSQPTEDKKAVSQDQFAAQREQALKTGSFDYKAVQSAFYGPPTSFINDKGQTSTRQTEPAALTDEQLREHQQQQMQSQAKLEADRLYNEKLTTLRQLAPGAIQEGSPQDKAIRAEADKLANERYKNEGYQQSSATDLIQKSPFTFGPTVYGPQETILTPAPKPVQEISSNTFQRVEQERAKAGLPSLGTIENVHIVNPTFPQETKPLQKTEMSTYKPKETPHPLLEKTDSSDLVDITSNITTKNGVTTTETTTPEQETQSLSSGITTTKTEYERASDNALKIGLASLVEPAAYIGLSFASLVSNITGKDVLGVKPGSTSSDVQTQITKSIGPTPLDQLMSGNVDFSNLSPEEKAAALLGTAAGLYLTGGANLKEDIGSLVSRVTRIGSKDLSTMTSKTAQLISSKAVQEGSLISSKPSEVIPGSNVFEFTQGTEGKSGIESFVPEAAPVSVERLPTGQVQATKAQPLISPTKEVTGIGPTGQAKPVQVPNVISLNPEAEGQAIIPHSLIGKESSLFIRSEPQEVLPPSKMSVTFEGVSPLEAAGLAVHLEAEPVAGMKGTFITQATPKIVKKFSELEKLGILKVGTDILQLPTEEVKKHPELYGSILKTPELIKGNKYPEIVRPNVIRSFTGRSFSHLKVFSTRGKTFTKPTKNTLPTGESFDATRYPLMTEMERPTNEAASNINELIKESIKPETVKPTVTKPAQRQDAFGSILSPDQRRSVLSSFTSESVLESFAVPPGTKFETMSKSKTVLSLDQKMNEVQSQRSDSSLALLEKQVNKTLSKSQQKNKSALDLIAKSKVKSEEKTKSMVRTSPLQSFKTDTIQNLIRKQTTTTTTTTKTTTGKPPPKIPEKPPKIPGLLIPEQKKKEEHPLKKRHKNVKVFLGNARESNIVGLYKRNEITYSTRKIRKQTALDLRRAKKEHFNVKKSKVPKF